MHVRRTSGPSAEKGGRGHGTDRFTDVRTKTLSGFMARQTNDQVCRDVVRIIHCRRVIVENGLFTVEVNSE